MLVLKRTDSTNPDFIALVKHLDRYLAEMDGKDHAFYAQYNKLDSIKHVVVAYDDDKPVACGAIKPFSENEMEVKRMYTSPESRGKGIAGKVLSELEKWARENGYSKCILETGMKQVEAVALYSKSGYRRMENFGQYKGVEYSLCFEKDLQL